MHRTYPGALDSVSRWLQQRSRMVPAEQGSQLRAFIDFNQSDAARLQQVYEEKLVQRLAAEQRLQQVRQQLASAQARLLQLAAAAPAIESDADPAAQTRRVYRFFCDAQTAVYGDEKPARRSRYRPEPVRSEQAAPASTSPLAVDPTLERVSSVSNQSHSSGSMPDADDARAPYASASLAAKVTEPPPSIHCAIIARAITAYRKRREAPRQPNLSDCLPPATIRIAAPGGGGGGGAQEPTISNIHIGDWVWVISYLDRNHGLWRCFVRPPRYRGQGRLGVFATRSPHRPNAIGISLVQVFDMQPAVSSASNEAATVDLIVRGCDLLNATPILGIEPYQRALHDRPRARVGWLSTETALTMPIWDDLLASEAARVPVRVLSDVVRDKLQWLVAHLPAVDIEARLRAVAFAQQQQQQQQKHEHAAAKTGSSINCWLPPGDNGRDTLCLGAYRLRYRYDEASGTFYVLDIQSGLRAAVLQSPDERQTDPEVAEHWAFCERFECFPASTPAPTP